MTTATQELAGAGNALDPRAEVLDEAREEQHEHATETAGRAVVGRTAALGTHDYFVEAYDEMDWTPEERAL